VIVRKTGGTIKWDSAKVSLLLHPKQKKGAIGGREIRDWLIDKPVYRANVLDYLLVNPHLIPNEWKPREGEVKFIFFWGDIYRDSDRLLYVRWLYWDDSEWQRDYSRINAPWRVGDFSAVLAS
jgi:hypothetical protein